MTRQNNQKRYDKSEKGRATKARYRDRFPEYQMIGYAKRRDKKLGLRCDLTREYLRAIWPRDNKCPYCLQTMRPKTGTAPSLDEVVYGVGHIQGNVAIVWDKCNRRKSDRTLEWFERGAAYIRLSAGWARLCGRRAA